MLCQLPTLNCPDIACGKPSGNGDCPDCTEYEISNISVSCDFMGQGSHAISWGSTANSVSGLTSEYWTEVGPLPAGTETWINTKYSIIVSWIDPDLNPGCVLLQLRSYAFAVVYPQSTTPSGIVDAQNGFGTTCIVQNLNFPAHRYASSDETKNLLLSFGQDNIARFEVLSKSSARAVQDTEHLGSGTSVSWQILTL